MVSDTRKQEHLQALYDGCSLSELAKVFKKNESDVAQILRNVKPSAERRGKPIWHLHEAAKHLVRPAVDIESWIKKLRPNDLPPFLLKEFWNGKLARQKFELEEGNLWPTESVMMVFSHVFKNLRAGILLFSDSVEAQSELTPKQRRLINKMADGLLQNLKRTLVDGDYDEELKPKKRAERVSDSL